MRVRWGRLALLALVLLAAALYIGPLRDFFTQQDRYQREAAALQQLKQQNAALHRQLAVMGTAGWVIRTARADFQLVPPDMQAFVVKGLPGDETRPRTHGSPSGQSLSILDRLKDLWSTLAQ